MRITFFVRDSRSKVAKASAELPLIIRLRNGQTDIWQNTRLSVNPAWWDKQRQQVRARLMLSPELRQSVDNEVAAIRQYVRMHSLIFRGCVFALFLKQIMVYNCVYLNKMS